jgi:hypothetical protein
MKTNHQRNFKDNSDPNSVFSSYFVFSEGRVLPLSDKSIGVDVTCGDHTKGKRGIAKDRRGAKKFLNSRSRFHENAATKRLAAHYEREAE